MLTNLHTGEGILVCMWETEADIEATEADPSYVAQMRMLICVSFTNA